VPCFDWGRPTFGASQLTCALHALYRGQLAVDEIESLAKTLDKNHGGIERLLGNHKLAAGGVLFEDDSGSLMRFPRG